MNFLSSLLNNVKTLIVSDLQLTSPTGSPYYAEYIFTEEPLLVIVVNAKIRGLGGTDNSGNNRYTNYPVSAVLSKGGYYELEPSMQAGSSWPGPPTASLSSDGLVLRTNTGWSSMDYSAYKAATCNYRIIHYN